jgi:hypothetical protein
MLEKTLELAGENGMKPVLDVNSAILVTLFSWAE